MKTYKEIFDYIINNYQYDYSVAYEELIEEQIELLYDTNLIGYHFQILQRLNQSIDEYDIYELLQELNNFKGSMTLQEFETIKGIYSTIAELQTEGATYQSESNKIPGTCYDFAVLFKKMCISAGLSASYIEGYVSSNGRKYHHAWNSVVENGEELYLDISHAIHAIDGSIEDTDPYVYFLIKFDDFYQLDGNTERTILVRDNEDEVIKTLT